MTLTYVHLSGRDLEGAVLEANGIKQEDKEAEHILKPKICQRCGKENGADENGCFHCGQPLDIKSALDYEEREETLKKELEEIREFKKDIGKLIDQVVEKKIEEMGLKIVNVRERHR